jgi:hypothetical protein
VHKALKISTSKGDPASNQSGINFSSFCVKCFEAWEESGYLFIRSELCEKGNLNDYLVELERE